MRLCIIALGTRGDVQPCLALARGLQRRGHQVRIVSEAEHEAAVRRHGLDFASIRGDIRGFLRSDMAETLLDGKTTAFLTSSWRRVRRTYSLDQRVLDCWHGCQDADALLVTPVGAVLAYSIAEKLQQPLVRIYYAPPELPLTTTFQSWPLLNRLTQQVFVQGLWNVFRPAMNRARREVLQLPPLPAILPTTLLDRRGWPVLCAYSAHVAAPPPDASASRHTTGYWFTEPDSTWQPPPSLLQFLAAGPPPIYVGFGSMTKGPAEATTALITNSLARAGLRAVIATGWGGLFGAAPSPHVHVIDDVPHAWLFERVSAVVHHGGAGTTAAGLRAGRPSLIVPFGVPDQAFFGQRVHALQAGPPPIPRKQLSVDALTSALTMLTRDDGMRRRAEDLGQRIRSENGVARAIEILESMHRGGARTALLRGGATA